MAATDIFQRVVQLGGRASLAYTEVEEVFKELEELRVFVNEGMSKVSKSYSCVTPHIQRDWVIKNVKSV